MAQDQLDIELGELAARIKTAAVERGAAEIGDAHLLDELQRRGLPPAPFESTGFDKTL